MINEDITFVRSRNPYFEKYFYDVFSMKPNFHQFPDGLKSDIAKYILEKAERKKISIDDYTEKKILDFVKEFVPDEKYLRLLYSRTRKKNELQQLQEDRKELKELKNTALKNMWWDFTAYRDAWWRKEKGIRGCYKEEIWIENPRRRR